MVQTFLIDTITGWGAVRTETMDVRVLHRRGWSCMLNGPTSDGPAHHCVTPCTGSHAAKCHLLQSPRVGRRGFHFGDSKHFGEVAAFPAYTQTCLAGNYLALPDLPGPALLTHQDPDKC